MNKNQQIKGKNNRFLRVFRAFWGVFFTIFSGVFGGVLPVIFLVCMLVMLPCGCQGGWANSAHNAAYIRPRIAVMRFENKAAVNSRWNLADGMADELINRLIHTRRYIVLEREHFQAMLESFKQSSNSLQQGVYGSDSGLLRPGYLIKAVLTDFGHNKTPHSKWNPTNWGPLRHNSQALVAATIYVIDLQNGQVMASFKVKAAVKEKELPVAGKEATMAFGSYVFYHTPLGQATGTMLDRAVSKINSIIEQPPFQPKVASIINGQVIINGGQDHRISSGDEFAVRTASRSVLDPDTGDILGHIAGQSIGTVRVIQVTKKYSIARVVTGGPFKPGETLFRIHSGVVSDPAAVSSY